MRLAVRDNVPAVAGGLTIVSLALVFGAVLGAIPSAYLPRAPDAILEAIPHVNAAISLVAIGLILNGWRWIRRGRVEPHRNAMLASAGLFGLFLVFYLYKVVLEGPAAFPGPSPVYSSVYLPLLAIHITLAVVCIPLLYYVLLVGLTYPINRIPETLHPRIGRLAAPLWLVSFVLGVAVYLLLYHVY